MISTLQIASVGQNPKTSTRVTLTSTLEIRAAILDGDIDKALKRTNAYYSHVLQDNPQIYFRLRCRKFVEIMRQAAEVLDRSVEKKPKFANGDASAISDDHFEPDMEIDEQLNGNDDWDRMETEEADNGLKYQTLTENALLYAQELDTEFKNDRNKDVKDELENIFAMFCYEDPRKSPSKIAHLLDRAGRVPVAEELNSAILGRSIFASGTGKGTDRLSVAWEIVLRRDRASLPANRSSC